MKKLSLKTETIRLLSDTDLTLAAGGGDRSNVPYQCQTYDGCSKTATNYCPSQGCTVTCYVIILDP